MEQFIACFEGLKDPRTGNACLHELLVITLCTVLSGGQGASNMAALAAAREPFLRGFLKLKNNLPSHQSVQTLWRICVSYFKTELCIQPIGSPSCSATRVQPFSVCNACTTWPRMNVRTTGPEIDGAARTFA